MSPPRETPLDVEQIRERFPVLRRLVNGRPLVYLDSAATTQKPVDVLDAVTDFYSRINSNVHRGVHTLSQEATAAFEGSREAVRRFFGAREAAEIVFVRGTTEAINLVAQSWGRPRLRPGDEILITEMEHHSNIVPWQMLAEQTEARLVVAPIDDRGALRVDEMEAMIGERTRIVSMVHVSNALGTVNPVRRVAERARAAGAVTVIDGAQAAAHLAVDVRELGCDFYAISGHKMFAPTGIGALYGRRELLEAMPPWQGGGDMIKSVTFERTLYNDVPHRFEAGTPDIGGAVGLAAAVAFLGRLGTDRIRAHELELLEYGTAALESVPGLRLIGTAGEKSGVLSFVLDGIHAHDIGTVLDHGGVAVRTGHHCAQPVMDRFRVPATARASLSVFNDKDDLDALLAGLERVRTLFR
ncbi:MAG: SufS family cysteine desulfurase [Candidatus Eiseniibacteriota bacterium]